jgi:hypothetical protein
MPTPAGAATSVFERIPWLLCLNCSIILEPARKPCDAPAVVGKRGGTRAGGPVAAPRSACASDADGCVVPTRSLCDSDRTFLCPFNGICVALSVASGSRCADRTVADSRCLATDSPSAARAVRWSAKLRSAGLVTSSGVVCTDACPRLVTTAQHYHASPHEQSDCWCRIWSQRRRCQRFPAL